MRVEQMEQIWRMAGMAAYRPDWLAHMVEPLYGRGELLERFHPDRPYVNAD